MTRPTRPAVKRVKRPARRRTTLVPWSGIRKHNRKRDPSSLEKKVYAMLEAEKIPFIREKTIGRLHVDILLFPKTVVELQGCFWHCCLVCNRNPTPEQQATITKDARREYVLRKQGYDVVIIWEHDVKNHPDRVQAMLRGIWDGIQKAA